MLNAKPERECIYLQAANRTPKSLLTHSHIWLLCNAFETILRRTKAQNYLTCKSTQIQSKESNSAEQKNFFNFKANNVPRRVGGVGSVGQMVGWVAGWLDGWLVRWLGGVLVAIADHVAQSLKNAR